MKYYVTGSSGFIGKRLVEVLKNHGHEVFNVLRPIHVLNNVKENEPFEFIHLSAYGNHYDQKDIDQLLSSNLTDLSIILKFVSNNNCLKFYNVSTSSIQLPQKTLYSGSKELGEMMVKSFSDPRFVNVRPYSVYGPGEAPHRFIPTVINAIMTGKQIPLDANAKHDWIYADDFINALLNGETNIGTGESFTNKQVVEILECFAGKKLDWYPAELRSYDTEQWVSPNSVQHISIYEGLKKTYEYFAR